MMIHLPVAGVSVSVLLLLLIGGGVGVMSGLFGVGGGFLTTPLLIFCGVPPVVAVGTQANQIAAASFSGVIAYWRQRRVDVRMALVMWAGGVLGSFIGANLLAVLQYSGQFDWVVRVLYIVTLGLIGGMMSSESLRSRCRDRCCAGVNTLPIPKARHNVLHGLPWRMRFPASGRYMSVLLPAGLGLLVGIMSSLMGIGGGIVLVPAMLYLIGVPAELVVGTSLLQVGLTKLVETFFQATINHNVDVLLAVILISTSVIGARIGNALSFNIKIERARFLLGLIALSVAFSLLAGLLLPPGDPFQLMEMRLP